MKPLRKLLFNLLVFSSTATIAQFGNNDPSFNPFDIGNGVGQSGYAFRRIPLPNDQAFVVNYEGNGFIQPFSTTSTTLTRINNSDGRVDFTFPIISLSSGVYSYIHDAAVLPNGKTLVVGTFPLPNSSKKAIAVFNSDGTIDNTFNSGGIGFEFMSWSTSTIHQTIVQPD